MRALRLAAVAAGLSLVAADASAAVITLTMTGTLSKGYDESGMFGAAGTDLTGAAFTFVNVFDTDLGAISTLPGSQAVYGGLGFDWPISPGSGDLTINGATAHLTGGLLSYFVERTSGFSSDTEDRVIVDDIATYGAVYTGLSLAALQPYGLQTEVHSTCDGGDLCTGAFFFGKEVDKGPYQSFYTNSGTFDVATYDVTVQGAVPEPATWAMMILGFGLAGASLRRRQLAA